MDIIKEIRLGLKSFKWIYFLAVSSIFLLLGISQILIQRSIQHQERDAVIINVAGKQRMLSQNITKTALLLIHAQAHTQSESQARATLSHLLSEWQKTHKGLQIGDESLFLPGNNSREVSEMFQTISPHFEEIRKATLGLLNSQNSVEQEDFLQTILLHEGLFLEGMNAIVKQYEGESIMKMDKLSKTEAFIALLTGGILLLEILFIFWPSYKRFHQLRESLLHTNRELKESQKQVEESAEAKENLFSVVTHELRTPLNAIIGVSDLMSGEELEGEHQEHVSILRSSSRQLLALINDILDLSKVRSGALELEAIPFDLHKEIREVRELFKLKAREKNLYLRFYIPQTIPQYVEGDPVRLRQILTNLIHNGLKFTKTGGITISAELGEAKGSFSHIIFTVADTGIGIPAHKIENIFSEFVQVDTSVNRRFGGTGLGLAITKQLIEKHGGHIGVESKEGEGSRFIFSLPFPLSSAKALKNHLGIHSLRDMNSRDLTGLRILVAEDDPMNQFVIKKLMGRWGVDFVLANNGREAIEYLIEENPFDLVLMDFDMPEMGGPEASRKIRAIQDPYFQHIPIIAITASAMEAVEKTLKDSGMNDFIPKPFYSKDLAGIIGKYAATK